MNDLSATTRVVFMGTPDFAVPSLNALVDAGDAQGWEVVSVYTQPDRRAGRGNKMVASPVKEAAITYNIPAVQPEKLRNNSEAIEQLAALAPDLVVVAAYGMILPAEILEIPTYGCINVHASLLPLYRGASPINAAILDGQNETGNSIMVMDEGLDTGPVISQEKTAILPTDTAMALTERLSHDGAALLTETLPHWLAGEIWPISQDELAGEPSVCRIIKKSAGQIDWQQPATHIERMTRAYHPWPSAFTKWNGQPFKVIRADVASGEAEPGRIVSTDAGLAVGCGVDLLLLREVQPAGKRPMSIESFANGSATFIGGRFE